jgi:hypothetical protein
MAALATRWSSTSRAVMLTCEHRPSSARDSWAPRGPMLLSPPPSLWSRHSRSTMRRCSGALWTTSAVQLVHLGVGTPSTRTSPRRASRAPGQAL